MKRLYRSVAFAAFVVGSGLTLLTGAQGDAIIDLSPRTSTTNFNFSTIDANTVAMQSNVITGPASFDGLTGLYTWPNTTPRWTGSDGANFNALVNALGAPASVSFSMDFMANGNVTGTVTSARLLGANTLTPEIIGTYTVASSSGQLLAAAFPQGSTEPFIWMLNTVAPNTTTPIGCLAVSCSPGTPASFSGGTGMVGVPGPIVGAGLPGLIAALGGLVAMARRRRKQLA